ncbi:MAG: hypothetical protein ACLGH0_08720, partial [Thermoanaerobaculia bacterium]
ADAAFPRGHTVRPTAAAIAANPALANHEYTAITAVGAKKSGNTEPTWKTGNGEQVADGDITWQERPPTVWPIRSADPSGYTNHAWFYEMLNRGVEDPWFTVRVRGTINGGEYGAFSTANGPHPYNYALSPMANAGNFTTPGPSDPSPSRSNYFQLQTYTSRPLYKEVSIPKFDYDFWKAAALAARGQKGAYYLQHVGSGNFTDGVQTKAAATWITSTKGFLFFDSNNNLNPQNGAGTLVTGTIDPCGAKGILYLNYEELKSTGCSGTDGYYNMPGEPYRDIGYRQVNETSSGINVQKLYTQDAAGNYITVGAYDSEWSYQDLPWSNGAGAKNGIFDVCVAQRPLMRESTGTVVTQWVPLPYFPNCNPGNNVTLPTCNCSEPHEPYLNIHYTGKGVGDKNSEPGGIKAYWDDPTAASSVYSKKTNDDLPSGTPVVCSSTAVATATGQEQCATNAYDAKGALAHLTGGGSNAAIGVTGLVYNEGKYNSTGNAAYFGAVVTGGVASPNGTQEIWFDECLTKGCWPPKGIPFPRVMVTSTQIQ